MKRIVIKIGTNLLTQTDHRLDRNNLVQLITQIATAKKENNLDVIIVSSGAIACGSQYLNDNLSSLANNQASASIGQILLMSEYRNFFMEHHINIGQILLTTNELTNTEDQTNIKNTIETLFQHHIVPIVNANDSVSTLQIESGDNDQISALIATLIEADALILLTNTDGLFTHNPDEHEEATLISTVDTLTEDLLSIAKGPKNAKSRGGMRSKVLSAEYARKEGVDVYIANGRSHSAVLDIVQHKPVGTFFPKKRRVT